MNKTKEKMDTVEKEFMAFPDIAADTINALLYQGQALTDAKSLWPGPTETIYQGRERLRDQYEDLSKYELIDGRIRVLSGETDIDDVEEWLKAQGIREEDEVSMCELFDQYERKGREEGIKCGEAMRLVTDIENVMRFFQVTLEKACEGLGTTVSRYEEAKKIL